TAFISEEYESELDDKSKMLIEHLQNDRKKRTQDNQQALQFSDKDTNLDTYDGIVRTLIEGDDRPPFIVNTSALKSPQSSVLVSHKPEKSFTFNLITHR